MIFFSRAADYLNSKNIDFPKKLLKLMSDVSGLWVEGDTSLLRRPLLGVVGSRKISGYGETVLKYFLDGIHRDIVVVSGFSRGIDSLAHAYSLQIGLKTVAVLPYGIDYAKRANTVSLEIIDKGGLLLSEFSDETSVRKWMFIRRNKLLSALIDLLLIIEAGEKSGTLITYKIAKGFSRKIFCVPGDIFRPNSAGICQMFADGAIPVISPVQINSHFGYTSAPRGAAPFFSSAEKLHTRLILEQEAGLSFKSSVSELLLVLNSKPMTLDELVDYTHRDIASITSDITELFVAGKIREEGNLFYVM